MSAQHSPTPWQVLVDESVFDAVGRLVATAMARDDAQAHEDADRIVACVNACEKLDEPANVRVLLFFVRQLAAGEHQPDKVPAVAVAVLKTIGVELGGIGAPTFTIDGPVHLGPEVARLDALVQGPPVEFDWGESLTPEERAELDENADEDGGGE